MKFLNNIFSSFIGSLLAFVGAFFVIMIIVAAIFASAFSDMGESTIPELTESAILRLRLNKQIVELAEENPFEDMDLPFGLSTGKVGVIDLVNKITKAKTDNNIKGIYLELSHIPAGYASLNEIRNAILAFKESGKPVIAYGEVMTEKTYFLASVADEVYLNPAGILEFKGFTGNVAFYKDLFDKLEIEPKVFRVGKFKSAVEPFLRNDLSTENREQLSAFLEYIYEYNLSLISESREIAYSELRALSDNLLVQTPEDALKYKLIDGVKYFDEVEEILKIRNGFGDKLKYVNYNAYAAKHKSDKNKVAVIVAQGDIMGGKHTDGVIGSADFVKDLRKARTDKDVQAIVVRINSPGGSALASDVMWREIKLASESKPVIASMSDVAASGGYYMAMACDTIVAHPNTITGSIGVFGLMFNVENFMRNKIGVTFDKVTTGKFSDIGSATRKMNPADSLIIQRSVNRVYEDFISKAAEGRRMDVEQLKEVAQGRVWSGIAAKDKGLVDVYGGLYTAINIAAQNAGVESFTVDYYPKEKGFFEKLESGYLGDAKQNLLREELGVNYKTYKQLQKVQKVQEMEGVQARIPFELEY